MTQTQKADKFFTDRINKIRKVILNDKNVDRIEEHDEWFHVIYKNGQVFKMRGAVVDSAVKGEYIKTKKDKSIKLPGQAWIIQSKDGVLTGRKAVKPLFAFEHFGELFFVHKALIGYKVTHYGSGTKIGEGVNREAAVKMAKDILDRNGKKKTLTAIKAYMRKIEAANLPDEFIIE